MILKGFLLRVAVLALCASHVAALTLASSKWIWKDSGFNTVAPFVTADFRRQFTSLPGKQAIAANILITGDNSYSLYVNGEFIGQGNNLRITRQYCVGLNPTKNLFAVANENLPYNPGNPTPNPAAFIAAIEIFYNTGNSDIIVTDSQWLAHSSTPNFYQVSFSDVDWKKAVVAASATSPPWSIPTGPLGSSSLSLSSSSWIWTNEVLPSSPTHSAPIGERAFRKKIKVPGGATVKSGVIIIGANDTYTLYINGKLIGSGTKRPQRYTFTLSPPTSNITIAVRATNSGGPAGLIAAIALNDTIVNSKCSSTQFYTTDGTWKFDNTVPRGFQQSNFSDASWPSVVVEGPYLGEKFSET